jgi:hypothetical protein
MSEKFQVPSADQQTSLEHVQVELLEASHLARCHQLLDEHHYLKSLKPADERLYYVATDAHATMNWPCPGRAACVFLLRGGGFIGKTGAHEAN